MQISWKYWRRHKGRAFLLLCTILVGTMAMTVGAFLARSRSQASVEEKLDGTGAYDMVILDPTKKELAALRQDDRILRMEKIYYGGVCGNDSTSQLPYGALDSDVAERMFHYAPQGKGRYPRGQGEIAGYKSTFEGLGVAAVVGNRISLKLYDLDGACREKEFRIVGVLNDQRGKSDNVIRSLKVGLTGRENELRKTSDLPQLFLSKQDLFGKTSMSEMALCKEDVAVDATISSLNKDGMLAVESGRLQEFQTLVSVEAYTQKELYKIAHLSYQDLYSAYVVPLFYGMIAVVSFFSIYGIASDIALDRKKQMGLLRSVGMSRRRTNWILVLEFGAFGLAGVFCGYFLGMGAWWCFWRIWNQTFQTPIADAFHAHIIARAVSIDPYFWPWALALLFVALPFAVVFLQGRNDAPLEMLFPEKKAGIHQRPGKMSGTQKEKVQKYMPENRCGTWRQRHVAGRLVGKLVSGNLGIVVILTAATWCMVFGSLFAMAKSDCDNQFVLEKLGKSSRMNADYYVEKDFNQTIVSTCLYNRHQEGVSQEDYQALEACRAVRAIRGSTQMPGVKVLYEKDEIKNSVKKALDALEISCSDDAFKELYEKTILTQGYTENEVRYQIPTTALDAELLRTIGKDVTEGTLDLEGMRQGKKIVILDFGKGGACPYHPGDRITLSDEVISNAKTENYDFSRQNMPTWEKPAFTWRAAGEKIDNDGYSFGKKVTWRADVCAVVRVSEDDGLFCTESSVMNEKNNGYVSPGWGFGFCWEAVSGWGLPDTAYTHVAISLKKHPSQSELDALEILWYQVLARGGDSVSGGSRTALLQQVQRAEQANLVVFEGMILLVVAVGIFGMCNAYLFAIRKNTAQFQLLRALGMNRRRLYLMCLRNKLWLPLVTAATSWIPVVLFERLRQYAYHYAFDLEHNVYQTVAGGKEVICWQARFPWYIYLLKQPVLQTILIVLLGVVLLNVAVGGVQLRRLHKRSIVDGIRDVDF